MDPRVATPRAGLVRQLALSRQLQDAMRRSSDALRDLGVLRGRLAERRARAGADSAALDGAKAADDRLASIQNGPAAPPPGARPSENLARISGELAQLYDLVQDADVAPTPQVEAAVTGRLRALRAVLAQWEAERVKAAQLDGNE